MHSCRPTVMSTPGTRAPSTGRHSPAARFEHEYCATPAPPYAALPIEPRGRSFRSKGSLRLPDPTALTIDSLLQTRPVSLAHRDQVIDSPTSFSAQRRPSGTRDLRHERASRRMGVGAPPLQVCPNPPRHPPITEPSEALAQASQPCRRGRARSPTPSCRPGWRPIPSARRRLGRGRGRAPR